MSEFNHRRLDRRVNRIQDRLPNRFAGWLGWLRTPRARWVRIPASLLLMVGGSLSFLPVLGIWMLPLGLVLLAYDVPFLTGPIGRLLVQAEWRWRDWKRRRRASNATEGTGPTDSNHDSRDRHQGDRGTP